MEYHFLQREPWIEGLWEPVKREPWSYENDLV
jgi:hypothetical protein